MCRVDEPVVHEQGDAEQFNDESLSENEYEINNGEAVNHLEQPANGNEHHVQDPLELPVIENKHHVEEAVQADGNAGNAGAENDSVIEIFESFEEANETDGNAGNAGNEGDSELEMYESYEELKEEPFEVQRLRESLDISGGSDCVIVGGYVECKVEANDEKTN